MYKLQIFYLNEVREGSCYCLHAGQGEQPFTSESDDTSTSYSYMPTASHTQATCNVTQHIQDNFVQHLHSTITNLQLQVTQLSHDIKEIRMDDASLRMEVDTVKATIARVQLPPQLHKTLVQRWHEAANEIIGAAHSRVAPINEYKCAHDGEKEGDIAEIFTSTEKALADL